MTDALKIKRLRERNLKRNGHLYELPDSEENISYLKCPVLGIRTLNLKKKYIEGVLGMTVDEFREKYPNQKLSCDSHSRILSKAMNTVDENGLSVHTKAMQKARQTLGAVGEDGLTGDERRGVKLRSIHLDNIDGNGLNGYQRIAMHARPRQITTLEKNHKTLDDPKWICYLNFCRWWAQQYEPALLNGRKQGRNGITGGFQLDHIYSISDGFDNHVSPFVISHINNLRILAWEDNAVKSYSSHMTLEQLLNRCNSDFEESINEFNIMMDIICTAPVIITSPYILERFNERPAVVTRTYTQQQV
jgi:hypothetical protein